MTLKQRNSIFNAAVSLLDAHAKGEYINPVALRWARRVCTDVNAWLADHFPQP